ncbi:hypothetical protein CN144_21750 [Sinorhizobium meliloti]|nr:hypothetical protein CN144_21750 [Sinorhizobium meliloti]
MIIIEAKSRVGARPGHLLGTGSILRIRLRVASKAPQTAKNRLRSVTIDTGSLSIVSERGKGRPDGGKLWAISFRL